MSTESSAADPRVEGAIESLNTAIDALNSLEDTKTSAEAAARRAAAIIKEELDELNRSNSKLVARMAPFLEARRHASEGIAFARTTEESWREASSVEAAAVLAKKERPKDTERKQALEEAARRARDARKEAKHASRVAEQRAVRLGLLGEAVVRAGYDVSSAVREYELYCKQRDGLEQVLELSAARLCEMENAKEAATRGVGDAMGYLEELSNELHETEGSGEAHSSDECVATPCHNEAPAMAPAPAPATDGSPSAWLRAAAWRPSKDWSEDSLEERLEAGAEWSEAESDTDEAEPQALAPAVSPLSSRLLMAAGGAMARSLQVVGRARGAGGRE